MPTQLPPSARLTLAAALVAVVFGSAQAPPPAPAPEPDARLVYESDTRAYYRPCG